MTDCKRILIYDDELATCRLLTTVLSSEEFETHYVLTEEDFWKRAEESWDLLILDLHLKQTDGYTILEKLEQRSVRKWPVVVLTSDTHEDTLSECFDRGATDFITKPFSKKPLLSRIKNCIQLYDQSKGFSRNTKDVLNTLKPFIPEGLLQTIYKGDFEVGKLQKNACVILVAKLDLYHQLWEKLEPEEFSRILKVMYHVFDESISQHHGLITKIAGNSIVAIFERKDGAQEAVAAAREIHARLEERTEEEENQALSDLKLGIALHSGEIMIGALGNQEHATILTTGEAFDIALHMEKLCRRFGVKLVYSERIKSELGNLDDVRYLERMRIRGCLDHIDLYEDFSADSKNVREAKKQTKGSMEKGISAYQVGDFQKCMSFMAECAKQYPSDSIVFDYLKRSHYYFKFPPDSVEHLDMGENLLLDWNFRRRYSRKPIKLKARICGRNGELLLQEEEITVVNFSSKGLCFKSNLFFKLQETLLITLTDPALGEILKVAQVRWAETTAEGESLVGLETEALELVDLDKSNSLIASYVKAPEQAMKVLILDDDLSQCRQTRQRLKQEGIEAGYITHSKDLVEKLESDHYQVLLLDLFMPDVDGFDVMKMLKTHERWCYLPVIVMTSETSNDELINKCFQLGASDFINKPPQIKALMARLRASVNTATVIKMKTEENKDMNTKLKQLLVRSEEDSRHKAMILANMSHELRTPLNGLVSTIDLIRSFSNETEEYEQLHQLMKRSSQRLVQTVNSFLNFSDSDSEEESSVVKAFHLEHTLESSVQQMAQKYIQKSLSFSLVLDPEVPLELKGDVMRFRQCFDSILDNAFKFTLDGEVTVLVVKLDISEHKARFRVHVADTGIGFDVSKADDLFEEFVQQDQSLSRNFEGSGLGLAIAKRSCHQLKSKIECKSVLGKGSEFWFDVEFDLQIPHQKHPSSLLASEPVEEKPKSILLVEDNEDNVELVQLLLRKKPWKLSIAVDGAQGVQKVKELSFDCVLMDVNMPVMDGLTATREIRALDDRERAQVPIVALTALVAAQDRQNCFDAGMNDYLSKPIEKKDLIAKIEEWIQQT